ncbi:MAG: ATP-binding protein [Candidatus Bipolaricaulota bacterium]|nr:ATP-binding protein [Candidatus Bipolaricaulota bacterium]
MKRIRQENPWWEVPHQVPEIYCEWHPRSYLTSFLSLVRQHYVRRAVVLMGPRRVGKTVLIHHTIMRLLEDKMPPSTIFYVSVDHPLYNGLGLEELLQLFAESNDVDLLKSRAYVFFDEIQYLQNWEVHLKSLVDSYPNLNLVASGSAAAALRLKSTESGAGRFTNFLLPPLTFQEYLMLLGLEGLIRFPKKEGALYQSSDLDELNQQFLHYLNFGGYPEVIFSQRIQEDPARFIKADIIDKVLLRDLPSLYGIQDIRELNSLFTTLAFNTANEVSLEALSKGSGVAKNTIKKYIEYLDAAFLIRVVHRVDRNARHFKRANFFKMYLTNPSIRAALFSPIGEEDPAMGDLVETATFAQWFHSDAPLHYARWKHGEVDIVRLEAQQKAIWAVEIKWSDRIVDHPEELHGLTSFCATNQLEAALVTTKTRREQKIVDGIRVNFVPASEYCYTVGKNLVGSGTMDQYHPQS